MPKPTSRDHYEMRDSSSSPQGKKNTGFYGFNGGETSSSALQRRTPNGQVYYAANEHQQPAARRTPSNHSTSTGGHPPASRSVQHSANTSVSGYQQPTSSRAPTTEEVEEKIRNLKKTMANDNSSRLAAYEARKHVMADARRRREDEARMAEMERPPSNLHDYQQDLSSPWIAQSASRVLHSVHADDLEKEGVEFGNDKPQHRQQSHHRDRSASRSHSVNSTVSRASSQEGERGPYNPTVGGVFPKNKYIDPSDVVYVNVQGRVNQLINQRRAASSQRQPSSEYGTVATYTHELETARMRRAVGQDRLRSEHHYSSYGVMSEEEADAAHWRQQPLRTIKTVDWRSKDESLILGKTPKSVKLRMQHTESVLASSALRPVLDQSEIKAGHVPDQKRLQRAAKRPQRTASQMAAQSFSALTRTQSRGLNVSSNPFNSSVGLVPHATAKRGLESTLKKRTTTGNHHLNNTSVSAAVEYTPRSRFEVPFDTELSPMSDCTAAGSPGHLGSTLKPHTMEALPSRHADQQHHHHQHDHRSPSPAHSSTTDRESSLANDIDSNNRNYVIRRAVENQRRKLIQQGVIKERPQSTTTAAPSYNNSNISSIREEGDASLAGYTKTDYSYYKAPRTSLAAPPKHHQQQHHRVISDMSSMSNNSRYVSPSKEEIIEASRYGGMSTTKASPSSSSSPRQHGRGPTSTVSPALKTEEVRKTLFSPEQPRPDPRFERYSPPRTAEDHPQLSARERLLAVSRQNPNHQPDNWRSARDDIVKQHNNSHNVSWVDASSPPQSDTRGVNSTTSNSTHVLVDDGLTDTSKSAQDDNDFWGLGQRNSQPTMGHGFGSIRSDLFHPTARQGAPQPTAAPKPHEPEGSGHPHRPHPSKDSVGAKRTTDLGYDQQQQQQHSPQASFDIARRAFSMGAPLPHEAAPPHQVRGDQQVSYYQEEEAAFESLKHSPPPQPNDPTRALLMQVLSAQQQRRR